MFSGNEASRGKPPNDVTLRLPPKPSRLFAFISGLAYPTPEERAWLVQHPEIVRVGRRIHRSWEDLQESMRVQCTEPIGATN